MLIGAFFAAFAAWLGASAAIQIVTFAVSGFFIVIPARRYLRHRAPRIRLGAETLPGKLAVCLELIDGDLQAGVVMLDGARWTATAARGTRIEPGATVEVLAVEGVRVVVALPQKPPATPPTAPPDQGNAA